MWGKVRRAFAATPNKQKDGAAGKQGADADGTPGAGANGGLNGLMGGNDTGF